MGASHVPLEQYRCDPQNGPNIVGGYGDTVFRKVRSRICCAMLGSK